METLHTLKGVQVSQVYAFVKTNRTVLSRPVHFTVIL